MKLQQYRFLLLFSLIFLFISCNTLKPTETFDDELEEKLPAVALSLDQESFSSVYSDADYPVRGFSQLAVYENSESNTDYENIWLVNFSNILDREFYGPVFEVSEDIKAYAILVLAEGGLNQEHHLESGELSFLLPVPYVFSSYAAEGTLKLSLQFYDLEGNYLFQYDSDVYSENAYTGVGGYSTDEDATYAATFELFTKALNDIKSQIVDNSEYIAEALN